MKDLFRIRAWLAIILAFGVLFACVAWAFMRPPPAVTLPVSQSPNPGMDALDQFTCAAGLERHIQIRGVEDGFARANAEPAQMRPAVAELAYYRDIRDDRVSILRGRDFDEAGGLKVLIDHFALPPHIVDGVLYARVRLRDGDTNDGLLFGDLSVFRSKAPYSDRATFHMRFSESQSLRLLQDGSSILELVLTEPVFSKDPGGAGGTYATVMDLMNDPARAPAVDFQIGNEAAVDFVALALCTEPSIARGVTFHEFSSKPMGPDISLLSCAEDAGSPICDPFAGDTICSAALPVACYLSGNRPMPVWPSTRPLAARYFTGGEIRLTRPRPGSSFASASDVSAYCAAEFGEGWRALTYHEGGGSAVMTHSRIEAGAQAWVHIEDQPRARCWDRPERERDPPTAFNAASPP